MAIVFLTGATGFVGGALAAQLCQDTRVERLLLLIRATDAKAALERTALSLARFGIPRAALERVEPIRGDLETFSLSRETLDSVSHVVHAAAHTSFRSTRRAWTTNVTGTERLGQMLFGAHGLQRLVYVGTAYRCGTVTASAIDEEMAVDSHLNEYTRSKAAAERALPRLPLLIVRPSVIVGHSSLGVAPSASLYWYYRALAEAGASPFLPERKRDIVPVDWVAAALVKLLFLERPKFAAYHLSAGARADTWQEICRQFSLHGIGDGQTALREGASLAGSAGFRALGLRDRTLDALGAIATFAGLCVDTFANDRLITEGMTPPPRFSEYLGRCVESDQRTIDALAEHDL